MYYYHYCRFTSIYLRPPPREFPELPDPPPVDPDLELGPILDELLGLLVDDPTERLIEGVEDELFPKDLVLRSTDELPLSWKLLRLSELLPKDLVPRSTDELPLSWKLLRFSELLPKVLVLRSTELPRSVPTPVLGEFDPPLRDDPTNPFVPTVERVLL